MIRFFFVLVFSAALPAWSSTVAGDNILGHIQGIPGDAVIVDIDIFSKLKPGVIGILRRKGVRIASVEVLRVYQNDVFLRVVSSIKGFVPEATDIVYFRSAKLLKRQGKVRTVTAKPGAGRGGEAPAAVLTPVANTKKKTAYKISTRVHGRAVIRQFYQAVTPGSSYRRNTRIDTDGTMDRIGGSLWSLTWSGNGGYREGNRPSISGDFRRFRVRVRRFTLARSIEDKGFFNAGRFFSKGLPGLGTVDGLALEVPTGWLSIGGVVGTRPDRLSQEFSKRETLGSIYASAETGTPGQGSFSATLGVMHTLWLGRSDELAALYDQNFDLGPLLSVYQSAQLDFNAGAAKFHKGVRLSRLDMSVNSSLSKWLVLRTGLNHFEPVDVAAERALFGGAAPVNPGNGYWRYWLGTGQTLSGGSLGFDEEISWTRTGGRLQPGLWQMTVWKQGLPWITDGRVYLTGYNVVGPEGTDYGGSTGVTLPMLENKFVADVNAGFHYNREAAASRSLKLRDASLRLDWRPNNVWQLDASASKIWQGSAGSYNLSSGLSLRW